MPFDQPEQMGSLAPYSRPDPMRAIIAGLRRASQPGTINQLGSEMDFYGRGDPLDIELAEEQRRTEHDRAMRRLNQSAATFVDPRLERDNPALAAKARLEGASIAGVMPEVQEGPLNQLMNSARMTERTLPITRGAERQQATLDANAEAENYSNPAQAGLRNAKRWDQTLDAKNAANTFMNPIVRQGRMEMRKEAPQDAGLEALVDFIKQSGNNPYGGVQLRDILSLFGMKLPGAEAMGGGAPGPVAGGSAGAQPTRGPADPAKTISMREIIASARTSGANPGVAAQNMRDKGYTITP